MGDTGTALPEQTPLCYSPALACSQKRQTVPPAVWPLAVGRQIKSPKSFYCREEQIHLQMDGVPLQGCKYPLAPAEITGKTVAVGPGAITSSSSLIHELMEPLHLITRLLS